MTAYLAGARRLDRHHVMRDARMSAEIIRFIRAPNRDCEQTDFPTIAFLSARPADVVIDKTGAPPDEIPDLHET
ncbi:hypothetical protein ACVJGD_002820 [Bradyrhizobium sp. USDA 10063]